MAAFTSLLATVATAAVGAGASIYASNQQSKAIKGAANQQQQAADQSIAYQREARDYARQVLSKYSVQGDAARAKMNTFLGLPQAPASQMQGYSGGMGSTNPAPGANRPHLMGRFNAQGEPINVLPDAMGAPQAQTADPTATPAETQEQAWTAYQQTPWGRIGQMEADKAGTAFLSKAGSQGGAIAGRTVRGMAEVGNEAQLRNFSGYYGALGGVADTGFNADTGIASGGQQFANSASNTLAANAANQGNLAVTNAQNKANMVDDLASWIGWGAGNTGGGGGGRSSGLGSSSAWPSVFGGSRIS